MPGFELTKDQLRAVNVVAAAHSPVTTDFKIILGGYEFKVVAEVLSNVSPYFRVLCNGGFVEASDRVVYLNDDDPCDFARLLQFVYTGEYDREPNDSNASKLLTLSSLVPEHEWLKEGWGTEEAREKSDIDKALWELADKYQVPSLREFVATSMILRLPTSVCHYGEKPDFATFQVEFVKVFEFTKCDLIRMPKINKYLADEVFNHWVQQIDPGSKSILLLSDVGDSATPADEGLSSFQRQLKTLMEENGSFAFEMFLGQHRVAKLAFEKYKWSETRIHSLCQHTHPVGPGRLG